MSVETPYSRLGVEPHNVGVYIYIYISLGDLRITSNQLLQARCGPEGG